MENVIHYLTLDLTGADMCPMIEVQRGDSARSLIISLTQGGRPYWIEEGLTAALYATKPDGNPLFNACTIEKNWVRYDFTPQTANVLGVFDCEIWLVAGDKRELTTPKFTIAVDERMRTDDVIPESEPEYTAITEMVAAGTAMIEDLREALAGLEGVEEILAQARAATEAASGSEKAAAESAQNANAAAEAAEEAREGAAAERAAAETAAADALGYAEDAEAHATAARKSEDNSRLNLHEAEVAAQMAQAAAKRAEEAAAGVGTGGNGSGQNPSQGGGMTAAAASLLITILRDCATYGSQTANIDALEALLTAGATPDAPPPEGVTQTGSVLTITSGVTVTQDGDTLNIT